jgi:predicted RNase H-like HicB family nuclease
MIDKVKLFYWKTESFWLGKLLEHPEIMTQDETLEELKENICDILGKSVEIKPILLNEKIIKARGLLKGIDT